MTTVIGEETIKSPLQKSGLNKKGLCDYVINPALGCTHGCVFCYVPSTPGVRCKSTWLNDQGVDNPQLDWGKYLFVRNDVPQILDQQLSKSKKWETTPSGKGVVLLSSTTDPFQNNRIAKITVETVKVLIKYNKRVRILTRSPIWSNYLNTLVHPNVTVGMSLPTLDDQLSRRLEPKAPFPRHRYQALQKGYEAGCRLFVAVAPTAPSMNQEDFVRHLDAIAKLDPEVIFWEAINVRGQNVQRLRQAGLGDIAEQLATKNGWANNFIQQWEYFDSAIHKLGLQDKQHPWPDTALKGCISEDELNKWFYKPTPEQWDG